MNSLNSKISFYSNIHDTENRDCSISDVMGWIKNLKYGKEITEIRNENDKKRRNVLKSMLPAVTISGLFNGRRQKENVVSHSGVIQIDLDEIQGDIEAIRNNISRDEHLLAIFQSPSGRGLKVLIKISTDIINHEKYFKELEKYFLLVYNVKVDKQCKDITRLMYLSSDKDIFINEEAKQYRLGTLNIEEQLFGEALLNIVSKNEFVEGFRNDFIFKLACECNRLGLDAEICFIFCKNYYSRIDFDEKEILTCIKSGYSHLSEFNIKGSKNNFKLKDRDDKRKSLLNVRTANQCMEDARQTPVPKMLFGELWHEKELCILFADSNLGKSILGVQIANSISKRQQIGFLKMEAIPQMVYYLDFEMGDKMFQKRYSVRYENNFLFDERFNRIALNLDFTDFTDFEDQLFADLEKCIQESGCKIFIIDNITFLKMQSTENAKDALPLMRKLMELKNRYGLSMLIIAHTPKRNMSEPISINHLAGSKHLSNFAESIFAIGKSFKDEKIRYLKQIKSRATEIVYHSENVIDCHLEQNGNFLGFALDGVGWENEHLKQITDSEKEELDRQILELKKTNPSLPYREIANRLNINHMRVKRVIDKSL